jgi:hypothetical protein
LAAGVNGLLILRNRFDSSGKTGLKFIIAGLLPPLSEYAPERETLSLIDITPTLMCAKCALNQ